MKSDINLLNNQVEQQKRQNLDQTAKIYLMQKDVNNLKLRESQIRELEDQLQTIKNPKTMNEKFQAIKGWFELKENEKGYDYQSRPASKVRETIQLMNWVE